MFLYITLKGQYNPLLFTADCGMKILFKDFITLDHQLVTGCNINVASIVFIVQDIEIYSGFPHFTL